MDWQALTAWLQWVFFESYKGRVGRLDYFRTRIYLFLAWAALSLVLLGLGFAESIIALAIVGVASIPVYLVMIYRSVTLDIQRFHDMDLSGWWVAAVFLVGFVPVLNLPASIIALVVLFLVPGTDGPNQFGERAKAKAAMVVKAVPVKAALVKAAPVVARRAKKPVAKAKKKSGKVKK